MTLPSPSTPLVSFETITAQALQDILHDGNELAVLDVRPQGIYAREHLLLSASAPYWRLELDIDSLVPRRHTRIVLIDADGSESTQAALKLTILGYSRIHILQGGITSWKAAGFELYSGTNVLSKAFGELLEHELGTPHIDASELKQRLSRGDNLVVVDSRTSEEFEAFSIPGAHSLPGAELVYRIGEVAPDPETLIVVNCAGRTRSIVGAQTLINAGLPNRVVSLRNGTMAWLIEGETLANGRVQPAPTPRGHSLDVARQRARDMAQRAGVTQLDGEALQALERQGVTVYRFDVRDKQEYLAGHLPGWRWAPGGQLVQATDEYAATRGAHIVLADWDGVRAQTTAAWLAQLGGYHVHVYAVHAETQHALEIGPETQRVLQAYSESPEWITPTELAELQKHANPEVIEIENSVAYARRHIAGARFIAPHGLQAHLASLPANTPVVLASTDGTWARAVAQALLAQGVPARPLQGGTAAWHQAGLASGQGRERLLTGRDDAWYNPYVFDTIEERDRNFNTYLDWELGLVTQLEREPRTGIDLKGSLHAPA